MLIFNFLCIYLGIPGLSFDIMLKSFAEEEGEEGCLDLLSDPTMEQFFTRGIRGGQSFIAQRYAEGRENPEDAGDHLLYVDGRKHFDIIVQKYDLHYVTLFSS